MWNLILLILFIGITGVMIFFTFYQGICKSFITISTIFVCLVGIILTCIRKCKKDEKYTSSEIRQIYKNFHSGDIRVLYIIGVENSKRNVDLMKKNYEKLKKYSDIDWCFLHVDGDNSVWEDENWYRDLNPIKFIGIGCKASQWKKISPQIAKKYDYLWFSDGDIGLDKFSWPLYKFMLSKYQPLVSQPSVLAGSESNRASDHSHLNWKKTSGHLVKLNQMGKDYRVEVMSPFISSSIWDLIYEKLQLTDLRSIWEIEFFYNKIADDLQSDRYLNNMSPVTHYDFKNLQKNTSLDCKRELLISPDPSDYQNKINNIHKSKNNVIMPKVINLESLKRFSLNDNEHVSNSHTILGEKVSWEGNKDREFMKRFYPTLKYFNTILDIGARDYNKSCKNLIGNNSKYYQLEPFPGKDINNDGLLECFVQYSLIKYPKFNGFFDVVVDFGVLGWDQIKLSDQDIEIYLQNIMGLLKPNGLYVLKVDTSSRKKRLNFNKFIEPHFEYTDFAGYKNGTIIDDSPRWRDMHVYFLIKKQNIPLSIPNDLIRDLIIVAHPDDESIWFGEILGPLCAVILVTCEVSSAVRSPVITNETRLNEFRQVMDKTGVKNWQILNFPQQDYRKETSLLKIKDLIPKLRKDMKSFSNLENIYTHNSNGEYGHPDHKSVHQAVIAAYKEVYNHENYSNKPSIYIPAHGMTGKFPDSKCKENPLRKQLLDIYDNNVNGTQYIGKFRNISPKVMQFKTHTLCVIILNYKRPHNLTKILPKICENKLIDEIIVSNGHPDFVDTSFKHPKINYIVDFENNTMYGGGRRFINISNTTCDFILYLDDDMIPSDDLIEKMYNVISNKNTLVGPISRVCSSDGYSFDGPNKNMILPGISMIRRQLVAEYIQNAFYPLFEDWLIKYHGNCEDLTLNYYLLSRGISGTLVKGSYEELDNKNGYSSDENHYKIRNKFCKKYLTFSGSKNSIEYA